MAPAVTALVPTEGVSLADIDTVLTGQLRCRRVASGRIARTFYDTFDGRLFRAGLVVEHEWVDGRRWLRVRRLGDPAALVQAATESISGPVAALADRRVRRALEEVAAGRALLPVVSTEGEQFRYARCDELDKTTVRLSVMISYATVEPPGDLGRPGPARPEGASTAGRRHLLDPVITVSPLRGHDAEFERLLHAVALRLGPRPAADPLTRAAAAAGLTLGLDPSDRRVELEAGAPATDSLQRLLARHADVIAANLDGVRRRLDEEFLHDLRVTLRSARAIVAAAEGLLDPSGRAALTAELRAVMAVTSPVRDLDVLRSGWAADEALQPLVSVLDGDHADARRRLEDRLDRSAEPLLAQLRRPPIANPPPQDSTAQWAARVLPASLRRLHRAARRAIGGAERSPPPGPGPASGRDEDGHRAGQDGAGLAEDPLHRTRKAAKRVRYLLDTFDPLYRRADVRPLRRALRALQEDLGAYQDGVVVAEALESAARRLPQPSTELLVELGRRSERHRTASRVAAERFAEVYAPLGEHHARDRRRLAAIGGGGDRGASTR
jgi:CHAD domain-containing protein